MKHYEIILTEDDEGFWLAKSRDIYGEVEGTPSEALLTLVRNLNILESGAMILSDKTLTSPPTPLRPNPPSRRCPPATPG